MSQMLLFSQSSCVNYGRPVRCLFFILFHVHRVYHFHHFCPFIYLKKKKGRDNNRWAEDNILALV